jgi:hypothetical protein
MLCGPHTRPCYYQLVMSQRCKQRFPAALVVVAGCYSPSPIIDGSNTAPIADAGVVDAGVDSLQAPNLAFLTTLQPNGNFGGLAGADQLCQAQANANNLTDTFRAVLWTADQTPTQRFAGSRGWVDLAGRLVADQPSDFSISMLGMASTEATSLAIAGGGFIAHGNIIAAQRDYTCSGWTQKDGQMGVVFPHQIFDALSTTSCDGPTRILCAGVGRVRTITPQQETGRIAFVAPRILLTNGIGQADLHCQTTALVANLPGTYLAMLATSAGAAATRFNLAGLPWRRVDGPRIADTVSDFFALNWKQMMFRDAKGQVPADFYSELNGLGGLAVVGTKTNNCLNWATADMMLPVEAIGLTNDTYPLYNFWCGSRTPIICLQQ